MSKRNKKQKKKNKKILNSDLHNPKTYFRSIGIKPIANYEDEQWSEKIGRKIRKQYGQKIGDTLFEGLYASENRIEFCHRNLELVKIWYGSTFDRLCLCANVLKDIPIVGMRNILDAGGGAGQMAFYMEKLWTQCQITVADKYSDMGNEWAREIDSKRVSFVDTLFPKMEELPDHKFDVVFINRVLSNIEYFKFPSWFRGWTKDGYFEFDDGALAFKHLKEIAETTRRLLKTNGKVFIIDSWSDDRVYILCKAFEEKGLYIDLDLFSPEKVSEQYSVIAFSKINHHQNIEDLPFCLSTALYFEKEILKIHGMKCVAFYELFKDGIIIEDKEDKMEGSNIKIKVKVFLKNGLLFTYTIFDNERKAGFLHSGIYYSDYVRKVNESLRKN